MKNKAKQKKEDLNFEKVWLLFQETDKKFQETDKKLRQLENLFVGQWGEISRVFDRGKFG